MAGEPIMAAAVYCVGGGGRCCGNLGLLHRGRGSAHQGARGSHGSELPFQLGNNAGFSNLAFRAMRAWQSVLHRAHVPAAVQVPVHVLLPWPGCRQVAPSLATHVPSEAHLWHSGQRESSHCIERAQVGRGSGVIPMGTCGEQHRVATVGHGLIDGGRPTPGPRACLALSNAVAAPIPHSVTGTLGGDRHIHAFVIDAVVAHGRGPVWLWPEPTAALPVPAQAAIAGQPSLRFAGSIPVNAPLLQASISRQLGERQRVFGVRATGQCSAGKMLPS